MASLSLNITDTTITLGGTGAAQVNLGGTSGTTTTAFALLGLPTSTQTNSLLFDTTSGAIGFGNPTISLCLENFL